MSDLGLLLRGARDVVGVLTMICELTCEAFEVAHCEVTLFGEDGRPVLAVDNLDPPAPPPGWLTGAWDPDPLLRELLRITAPLVHPLSTACGCPAGHHVVLLPILELGSLLGAIRCGRSEPYDEALQRDLSTFATQVSMRLGELHVTAMPDPVLSRLTKRQREIATLVAGALSNPEIAGRLGLSENTVKKHLKDIYARLQLGTRTELATKIRRGPDRVTRTGVSRRGKVTVTHGPKR